MDSAPIDPRLTERRNPRSAGLDRLDARGVVELIQAEDRTVADAVAAEAEGVARAVELARDALRAGGRLIYVGAGTSGRLGVLDASEMPPTFRTDPSRVVGIIAGGYGALVRAEEGAEDHPEDGAAAMDEHEVGGADFVLGIATSGTTPYVHGALDRALERGATTGLLLCTDPDPDWRRRHAVVIAPRVGPEVVTGSTRMKAGTATKMVLNQISTGAMVLLGKTWGNLMVDLQVNAEKLRDRGERILMEALGVTRGDAADLLRTAEGHVKAALVMGHRSVSLREARRLLDEAEGRVGEILGEPPAVTGADAGTPPSGARGPDDARRPEDARHPDD